MNPFYKEAMIIVVNARTRAKTNSKKCAVTLLSLLAEYNPSMNNKLFKIYDIITNYYNITTIYHLS
jgi:hypothetical protein